MIGPIQNSHGETLDHSFHLGDAASKNLVILGHGVTGNKDRPFIVALANGLAAAGINALRISFAGNGTSGGKFTDATISKEVADLGAVLDACAGWNVAYIGHSMGGAVGVLRASQDERIRLLVSLAGMVRTAAFAQREFGTVKPGAGFMWDDEACPLSQAYMDDLTTIGTVLDAAPKIKVPWLLVHGTEDDVVPIQDSKDILIRAGRDVKFVVLQGSNHVFAGDFTAPMIETVVGWVKARWA
ncbi:MAG: alpha/beta fold hydrolase [Verrucomicrobia bacterium]|nr:alpha/beta fold hydrolase [Verrucomicrobiota bacterium]NBU11580.1 alpha/beta fold hydrolase [Pseudomonadota bacterium]NDA67956.1 alpha/beta fold hydrolase [Verrucomicrobiota bacterium]NDB78141.1 alpha/beta fold hydrolase [Verrucomicrobiota bacterium]NDD39767.1 alpha/beta fold hydrolase [Verrucomicrobiota bacterium]